MDNCGISLREMIEIVAYGDTFIVHCPLRIVNFYRNEGAVNKNLYTYLYKIDTEHKRGDSYAL